MSATNDNSPFTRLQLLLWALVARLAAHWWLRACFRGLAGSFPVGAIWAAVSDVPNNLPGTSDRIGDLAAAGAMALLLVLFLRWVGKKHGGIVAAIKLTAWSYCFQQALVIAAYGTWIAAVGVNGTQPDMGLVTFLAALAVGLFIPSSIMLRRLDPDY